MTLCYYGHLYLDAWLKAAIWVFRVTVKKNAWHTLPTIKGHGWQCKVDCHKEKSLTRCIGSILNGFSYPTFRNALSLNTC
jgi:hypothetical protein